MKCWLVFSRGDHAAVVLHASSRGRAKQIGACALDDEFIGVYAIRMGELDGRPLTVENQIAAGAANLDEDELAYYLLGECRCDLCRGIPQPAIVRLEGPLLEGRERA